MEGRDLTPRTLQGDPAAILFVGASGKPLLDPDRARLLASVRAGVGPAKLTIQAVVFRQGAQPNRNFVRFKPEILAAFAASFGGREGRLGVPFLRDHEQRDLLARGGTVIASELVDQGGVPALRQTIELVKPWAIEAALDGTLDRFSIGWNNTGPVECSICAAPMARSLFGVMPSCDHFPGDEVELDGGKRFAELVVTGAEGVETSAVSVPAVSGTGIGEIRAALAAERVRVRLAAKEIPMQRFPAIATALALSPEATEAEILAGIGKITAELERTKVLHAAEAEGHASARARLGEAEALLAASRAAELEAHTVRLLAACRRKVGQTLGDDGLPIRGGKQAEITVLGYLSRGDVKGAEAFIAELPQLLHIGEPMLSRGTEPEKGATGSTGRVVLTEQQRRYNARLGVSDAQWIAAEEKKQAQAQRGRR